MTFSRSDLPHLKSSLLIFLCALSGGVAALLLSQNHVASAQQRQQAAQRELNEAQRQLADARNRLTAAQDDQQNRATYAKEYARLVDRKIIGIEQRLDWIEGLDSLRRQGRVLNVTYTITPQRPYTPAPPLESGNFDLNLSPLNLHLDLLHEGQLVSFLDALRSDMKGWFMLEHCALSRSGAAFEDSGAVQLKAECNGGWLTLKNRSQK